MAPAQSLLRTQCLILLPRKFLTRLCRLRFFMLLLFLPWTLTLTAQAQFSFGTNNGTLILLGYSGSGGEVNIPSTYDGLPVTAIRDHCFSLVNTITSVTIPDTVTSIGPYAFQFCYGLTNFVIGAGVTNIPTYTCYNCINLRSVTLGLGVSTIESQAFGMCGSLLNIILPDTVTNLDLMLSKTATV